MVRAGGGGGSVETTAQRGTSGEALVSKGDRLHSKRGRAEVAMAQKWRLRVFVCYLVRFEIARQIYDGFVDSPSPKPAIFFHERLMAAWHEEGCYEQNVLTYFFCFLKH